MKATVYNDPYLAKQNQINVFNQHGIDLRQVNDRPMRELIPMVLPKLCERTTMVAATKTTSATIDGKCVISTVQCALPAGEVLPWNYWENNALTVAEIVSKIQSLGYIAKKATVAMTLNVLGSDIGKEECCSNTNPNSDFGWGRPPKRYFMIAK